MIKQILLISLITILAITDFMLTGCKDTERKDSSTVKVTWSEYREKSSPRTVSTAQKFYIGNIVHHAADKNFVGQVVNTRHIKKYREYLVCFPPKLKTYYWLYAYEIVAK